MVARRASNRKAAKTAEVHAPRESEVTPHHIVLEGINDTWEGHLWAIPRGMSSGFVGRTKAAQIWIKESQVSEKHARFFWDDSLRRWSVEELGSSNGSSLNGVTLEEEQPQPIKDGDIICFGPVKLRVHIRPPIRQGITLGDVLTEESETRIDRLKTDVQRMEVRMRHELQELNNATL